MTADGGAEKIWHDLGEGRQWLIPQGYVVAAVEEEHRVYFSCPKQQEQLVKAGYRDECAGGRNGNGFG